VELRELVVVGLIFLVRFVEALLLLLLELFELFFGPESDWLFFRLLLLVLLALHKVRLFLRDVPEVLRDGNVDCLEALLDVAFDHVNVLADLVLERLVDLEEVHFNTCHVFVRLSLVLLEESLLVLDLLTLVDQLYKQSHAKAVEHKDVVQRFLKVRVLVQGQQILSH